MERKLYKHILIGFYVTVTDLKNDWVYYNKLSGGEPVQHSKPLRAFLMIFRPA